MAGEIKKSKGRRVLLFPLPFQGHINPMLSLAEILHSRGFAITIFHTPFNSIDPTSYSQYQFISVPDGISDELTKSNDYNLVIRALNEACEASFHDCLTAMLSSRGEGDTVACLVCDRMLHSAQAVAKRLCVPTLFLHTSSAAYFNMISAYPLLCEKGYIPAQDSQLDVVLSDLPPYRVRDLFSPPKSILERVRELIARTMESTRTSSGLIVNTFDAIEHAEVERIQQEFSIPVFAIGPFHKLTSTNKSHLSVQDRTCLDWLDRQAPESVLFVSFGTLVSMNSDVFMEMAWGLANSGEPFLWVVRGSTSSTHIEFPEGFQDEIKGRGLIVDWAPQKEVLAHQAVRCFWTHSGWNSTLEGISEGVPMLCTPQIADQLGNRRYACYVWKVGLELEQGSDRDQIRRAIKRMMREREGAELRERIRDLKSKTTHCVSKGGSSYLAIDSLVNHILSL